MRIAIVGPCAAGKTTLQNNLVRLGYDAHAVAQEHSEVQAMWQQIAHSDILVYLDASLETIQRRLNVDWEQEYLDRMNRRLTHARVHAHFYLDTNQSTPAQVCERVVEFLISIGVHPEPRKEQNNANGWHHSLA